MAQTRILFVDDEVALRLTLPAILERHGYQVEVAASVPEALDAISRNQFDVLLSDLNVGEPGDGFTVVSAMRRTQPRAVTCILTGYPDFELALRAIRNQVDEYFVKPAEVATLVERIENLLGSMKAATRDRPLPIKRVSQILRDNEELLVASWLKLVTVDIELSDISLSREDRMDHIPKFLHELATRVETDGDDNSERALEVAEEHGSLRYEQGYTIPQIMIESRLLQRVLLQSIQAHLLIIDISTVIPDMMRVGESLASMVEESIRAYQEAERRALGRKAQRTQAKRNRGQSKL